MNTHSQLPLAASWQWVFQVGLLGDHGHCHRTQSHFALQRSDRDVQLCTRGYADHDLHPLGPLLSAVIRTDLGAVFTPRVELLF